MNNWLCYSIFADQSVFRLRSPQEAKSAYHLNEIFGENVSKNGTARSVLRKENGNVLYYLPENRVVPVEKQMKRSIFSGTCNCGQMVQIFQGIPVKARKREYLERYYLFSENISPFHLNSPSKRFNKGLNKH